MSVPAPSEREQLLAGQRRCTLEERNRCVQLAKKARVAMAKVIDDAHYRTLFQFDDPLSAVLLRMADFLIENIEKPREGPPEFET